MPGSNGYSRTDKTQADWPKETAGPNELVHWGHHPDAIAPGDEGCFSGSAFVDDDGTVASFVTKQPYEGQRLGTIVP